MARTKIPRAVVFLFLCTTLIAAALRLYGMNWDAGFHLHPDERMLIMVADRIHLFKQLDPDFFNYGSLPIYILRGTAQFFSLFSQQRYETYDNMLYVGRYLSVAADMLVLLLVYRLGLSLFGRKSAALLSAFVYAVAVFPIQNSHFFVVDVFLNLFLTAVLYFTVDYIKKPSISGVMVIAIFSAAAITTKITGILILPICGLALYYVEISKVSGKKWHWNSLFRALPRTILFGFIFFIVLTITSFIFMPYGFVKYATFWRDITLQTKMNSDPYIFPYTLQYVATIPYLYHLKNIFLWGLGPAVSLLSLAGLFAYFKKRKNFIVSWPLVLFYIVFFLIIGKSAVKFMRYLLPLYPLFSLMAGYALFNGYQYLTKHSRKHIYNKLSRFVLTRIAIIVWLTLLTVYWTIAFMNIYSHPHSRLQASEWINRNIRPGSVIATEHWDDRLPLFGGENYRFEELQLYDVPDNETKWQTVNSRLQNSDYIVIASNRLYTPLQHLTDCKKFLKCYPKTAEYYHKLFNGELSFRKVAEFSVYPQLNLGPITFPIIDTSSDESFTVYDHPTVYIFKQIYR